MWREADDISKSSLNLLFIEDTIVKAMNEMGLTVCVCVFDKEERR